MTFDARVRAELSAPEASSGVGSQAFDLHVWTPQFSAPSGHAGEFDVDILDTVGHERLQLLRLFQRLREEFAHDQDVGVLKAPLRAPLEDTSGTETETNPEAIADNWIGLALSGLSEVSYDRIAELANTGTGSRRTRTRALSSNSLRQFLSFWRRVRDHAREPEFVLCPNGHLQAEWHKNWHRHLEIEFCEDGNVFYGLFNGNRVHEGYEESTAMVDFLLGYPGKPLAWGQ